MDQPRRTRVSGVLLAVLGGVVLISIVIAALVLGGFYNAPAPTRSPAELAELTPDALAEAPGLGYDLTIEVGEAGALMGMDSSGLIDLQARRFSGSADRGQAQSMLLFGGPESGSVVLADGLFIQTEDGPWEGVPAANATQLRAFLDPASIATMARLAIQAAEIDTATRTTPCGPESCQVINLTLPTQAIALVVGQVIGQQQPAPIDMLPVKAELWLDQETGFPRRVAIDATAGGTTTKIVLELERLDPPPVITPPAP